MSTHVVALFDERREAEAAVEDLISNGIARDRVSLIASDNDGKIEGEAPMVAEGAAAGLTTGAVVGGVLGLLAGAGIGFVPVGIAIAGPLSGALAGGAAGAATGGVLGGLVGLGIPNHLATAYDEGIRTGGAVVAVQALDEDVDAIEGILDRDGAVDVHERVAANTQNVAELSTRRVGRYVRQDPPQKEADIPDGRREVNAEDEYEPYQEIFRADFSARNLIGETFEQHEPAYRFGCEAARQDEFQGFDWSAAEAKLQEEWESRQPGTWERYRGAVLAGWNRCHATVTAGRAQLI
jgi:hypothetical protein